MMKLDERIHAELDRLEQEKDIKILLAVESGGRASSQFEYQFVYLNGGLEVLRSLGSACF